MNSMVLQHSNLLPARLLCTTDRQSSTGRHNFIAVAWNVDPFASKELLSRTGRQMVGTTAINILSFFHPWDAFRQMSSWSFILHPSPTHKNRGKQTVQFDSPHPLQIRSLLFTQWLLFQNPRNLLSTVTSLPNPSQLLSIATNENLWKQTDAQRPFQSIVPYGTPNELYFFLGGQPENNQS